MEPPSPVPCPGPWRGWLIEGDHKLLGGAPQQRALQVCASTCPSFDVGRAHSPICSLTKPSSGGCVSHHTPLPLTVSGPCWSVAFWGVLSAAGGRGRGWVTAGSRGRSGGGGWATGEGRGGEGAPPERGQEAQLRSPHPGVLGVFRRLPNSLHLLVRFSARRQRRCECLPPADVPARRDTSAACAPQYVFPSATPPLVLLLLRLLLLLLLLLALPTVCGGALHSRTRWTDS